MKGSKGGKGGGWPPAGKGYNAGPPGGGGPAFQNQRPAPNMAPRAQLVSNWGMEAHCWDSAGFDSTEIQQPGQYPVYSTQQWVGNDECGWTDAAVNQIAFDYMHVTLW